MNTDGDGPERPTPEQAFTVLGNRTRLETLRVLADAGRPVSFTELRNRVGLSQGTQFNYHLTKLLGHFVEKTDAGYELREPGRRIVQAVLAGAVDEGPALEPTAIDYACHFCGDDIEVSYADGHVALHCPTCAGNPATPTNPANPEHGNLARLPFPPAGMVGRSPEAALRAAATWIHMDSLAAASGVCPSCAATVKVTIAACGEHESATRDGRCTSCDRNRAVRVTYDCTNCVFTFDGPVVMALLATPEVLAFVGRNGLNVTSKGFDWGWEYDETVVSTDPFEGCFTFTIGDDSLTLTVDDELSVVDATL
ncbi:DUF7351 domain-containing protein [Haloarchaeobius sp. DFWS5]|uniref:winged helix-turn-helix domain-containing protein n=1 Tax=Haloarchaeobius sp. DFWS5 TaxID=3446114 RepID=UPI003EB9C4FD